MRTSRTRAALRTEHFVHFALVSLVVLISLKPTWPNDLWWHLAVGRWVVEEGQIPATNRFAWSVPADAPYVYAAWLGDVLLFGLHQLGGVELLIFTRNVLAGGLLALIALETQRRNRSWRYASFAVLGAGLLLANNVSVRPQTLAWLPFGLELWLLGRYVDGKLRAAWLAVALTTVMLFWVNVHGSFVLGLAIAGAYLVGELVEQLRAGNASASRERLKGLALAFAAMAAASLVNPQGIGIYRYVRTLLSDAPSQRLIMEWQPPTPQEPASAAFFGSVLVLLVVWAHLRQPPPLRDLLLVCGFLWLAWSGIRYVFWYGVVAMPILVEGLVRLRATELERAPAGLSRVDKLVMALLLLPVLAVQPWFGQVPALVTDTPVGAVEYLRREPGGRLFNEMAYGSYVIWALPDQRVFIDPRVDLFPFALWRDYVEISQGRDAIAILDRHRVDRVLLSRQLQANLAAALNRSGVWAREYADADAEVWRRVAASSSPG